MCFRDLSLYSYLSGEEGAVGRGTELNVGWLAGHESFDVGSPSQILLE